MTVGALVILGLDASAAPENTAPPPAGSGAMATVPPPAYGTTSPTPNSTAAPPPPVMASPPGQQVVMLQPAMPPPEEDRGRFRVGWDIGGGVVWVFTGNLGFSGGAFNLGLRLGWQFNRMFAAYYQGNLPIGVVASASNSSGTTTASGGAVVEQTNAAMGEVTLVNIIQLGLGPSFDYVAAGIATASSGGSASARAIAGSAFGLHARAALSFGGSDPGRRRGFSLGFNLHPTFTGAGTLFFATLGLGGEWY